jgi:hypothetical protein
MRHGACSSLASRSWPTDSDSVLLLAARHKLLNAIAPALLAGEAGWLSDWFLRP